MAKIGSITTIPSRLPKDKIAERFQKFVLYERGPLPIKPGLIQVRNAEGEKIYWPGMRVEQPSGKNRNYAWVLNFTSSSLTAQGKAEDIARFVALVEIRLRVEPKLWWMFANTAAGLENIEIMKCSRGFGLYIPAAESARLLGRQPNELPKWLRSLPSKRKLTEEEKPIFEQVFQKTMDKLPLDRAPSAFFRTD